MMDRKIILDEARATLERVKGIGHQRDDAPSPPPDDRVARWQRQAEERARQRECARAELSQPDLSEFDARVQSMIDTAIANERKLMATALGEEVGKLLAEQRTATMSAHLDEIRELKVEIAKLGHQTATLREMLTLERDLTDPKTIPRRVN
jgi:hypothetical protein